VSVHGDTRPWASAPTRASGGSAAAVIAHVPTQAVRCRRRHQPRSHHLRKIRAGFAQRR
jgi:hypothetical protein